MNHTAAAHMVSYLVAGLPVFAAVYYISQITHRTFWQPLLSLSLIKQGIIVATIFTSPMFIDYALTFSLNLNITTEKFLIGVVSAGLF